MNESTKVLSALFIGALAAVLFVLALVAVIAP